MDQPAIRAYGDIQAIMKANNISVDYERGDHLSCLTGESFVATFKGNITGDLVGKAREIIEDQGIVGRMAVKVDNGDMQLIYRGRHPQVEPMGSENSVDVTVASADFVVADFDGKPAFVMDAPPGRMMLVMEINQAEEIRDALAAAIQYAKSRAK